MDKQIQYYRDTLFLLRQERYVLAQERSKMTEEIHRIERLLENLEDNKRAYDTFVRTQVKDQIKTELIREFSKDLPTPRHDDIVFHGSRPEPIKFREEPKNDTGWVAKPNDNVVSETLGGQKQEDGSIVVTTVPQEEEVVEQPITGSESWAKVAAELNNKGRSIKKSHIRKAFISHIKREGEVSATELRKIVKALKFITLGKNYVTATMWTVINKDGVGIESAGYGIYKYTGK